MTPEIKLRIELIRRGEVPEGFSQINDLIYPLNWERKTIAEVGSIVTGSTPSIANREYYVGNRLFITPSDFNNGIYITRTDRKISESAYVVSRVIPANSIYVVCIGATIGKINVCLFDAACNQQINAIIPKREYCFLYLYYAIDYYFNRIKSKYIGEQTLPIVSKGQFCKISIIIPSLKEQQKIAAILTTQDKVIELKEKLFAEKQRQKKYLMQQLLSGKKRLSGFNREWKIKLLKQLSEKQKKKNTGFQYSLVLSNSAQHGIVPQDQEFDKGIANEERIDGYYIVVPGAFVYNPRISITAPCGPINVNETGETGVMSPLYTVFTISSLEINQVFLKYYFQTSCWYKYVKSVANYGARHDRISISDEDFFDMPIPLPAKEEQAAIAEVLSTTDREIDLLRQDIEQEKQKKKALMQLLLTGIVRVTV